MCTKPKTKSGSIVKEWNPIFAFYSAMHGDKDHTGTFALQSYITFVNNLQKKLKKLNFLLSMQFQNSY